MNLLHYELSVVVAAAIGAEPFRCWRNAVLAILTFPDLFVNGTYVEGWIVVPREQYIEIVEHGWCTSLQSGIIDPSIVLMKNKDQRVIYFPGFELFSDNIAHHIAGKTVPLVCNSQYGKDGMRHQGYKQSYENARRQAQALAQELHLQESAIKVSKRGSRRGLTIIAPF